MSIVEIGKKIKDAVGEVVEPQLKRVEQLPTEKVQTTEPVKPVEQSPTPEIEAPSAPDIDMSIGEANRKSTSPEFTNEGVKPVSDQVTINDIPATENPRAGRIDEILSNVGSVNKVADDIDRGLLIDAKTMVDTPYHVNPATFQEKGVIQTLATVAQQNKEQIMSTRRGNEDGVLTDDMLYDLAKDLGMNGAEEMQRWKSRLPNETFNAETVVLMKDYLTKSSLELKDLAHKVKTSKEPDSKLRTQFAQKYADHVDVQDQFMGMRAEAGRALRAFGLGDDTGLDLNAFMSHVEAGMDIDKIAQMIDAADTVGALNKAVEATKPSALKRAGNVLHETFINSILSGIKTHIVNTTGSALQLGMHRIDTFVGSYMGKGTFGFDEAPDALLMDIDSALAGGFADMAVMQEAWRIGMKVAKSGEQYAGATGEAATSKVDVYSKAISARALGIDEDLPLARAVDMVGSVIRAPTERLMGGTDGFFRYMAEQRSLLEQAYMMAARAEREGLYAGDEVSQYLNRLIDDPTAEMKEVATDFAQRVVYQQDTKLTRATQSLLGQLPMGRWIVPFVRTPINMISQSFGERTPLGLLNSKIRADLMAGGVRGQLARSRMATGTAISLMFFSMAMNGEITGSEPKDKARRDAFRAAGIKPRSFRFENPDGSVSYISYDRLEPMSFLFGTAADVALEYRDAMYRPNIDEEMESWDKVVSGMVLSVANNVLDKTFMTGIQSTIEAFTRGGDTFDNWSRNYMASTVPYVGLRRDLTKFYDDTIRTSETLWGDVQKNLGAFSENLPARLDVYGEEVNYDHVIAIWKEFERSKDQVKLEVAQLAADTRMNPIPQVYRAIGGIRLSNVEYSELITLSRKDLRIGGQTFKEAVTSVINSGQYARMTQEDKVRMLKKVQRKYDSEARNIFIDNNAELAQEIEQLKRESMGVVNEL